MSHVFSSQILWHQMKIIDRGANRICVQDPAHDQYCLKYLLPHEEVVNKHWRQWLHRFLARRFWYLNDNVIEWRGYQKVVSLVGADQAKKYFSACVDLIEHESLGIQLRCEFIQDQNGQPIKSLYQLFQQLPADLSQEKLLAAIDDLKHWLIMHHIPLFDLNMGNLLLKIDDKKNYQLCCIDAKSVWSSKELIPWSYYFKFLMHKKIERRITRLSNNVVQTFETTVNR